MLSMFALAVAWFALGHSNREAHTVRCSGDFACVTLARVSAATATPKVRRMIPIPNVSKPVDVSGVVRPQKPAKASFCGTQEEHQPSPL
jgi:hypothetical protein